MELLNILIGLTLDQILHVVACGLGLYAFWYMAATFVKRKTDNSEKLAQKAIRYNQVHKKYSTGYYNQLAKDTEKENEYLVNTGFPEQNKRCGFEK